MNNRNPSNVYFCVSAVPRHNLIRALRSACRARAKEPFNFLRRPAFYNFDNEKAAFPVRSARPPRAQACSRSLRATY